MVEIVRMPMMGNTMETGTLLEWLVATGDPIEKDEPIALVESEKATAEIQSTRDGTLARIDVEEGEEVPPGTALGVIVGPDETLADAPEPKGQSGVPGTETERANSAERYADAGGASGDSSRRFASPTTRRFARARGVPLESVPGTGVGGRVTESDVRAAAGETDRTEPAAPVTADENRFAGADVPVAEAERLSGVRRTIARRMTRSAREIPQVTLHRTVDVGRVLEAVEELTATAGTQVGFTDLLVAATATTLREKPRFNAWFEGETLRMLAAVNVAVAVDREAGLVTPVIRKADRRGIESIAEERRRLTEAALNGSHTASDLEGATFTITNLGMFGVDSFDPLVNPPQIAILGVGEIENEACTLSLSFDHRAVDGADAARFLDELVERFTAPTALVSAVGGGSTETADETGGDPITKGEKPSDGAADIPVATLLRRDLDERAREVAAHHGWPVPDIDVELRDGNPIIRIEGVEASAHQTARRLLYAAARESTYADSISGLRDPEIVFEPGSIG